jgi:hypothetical protein
LFFRSITSTPTTTTTSTTTKKKLQNNENNKSDKRSKSSKNKVSVFWLKNHHPFSMVFAWLWGYEFAVPPMFSIHAQHRRLKKTDFLSQHVEAKSASLFNVFALPQFVRQTNANT